MVVAVGSDIMLWDMVKIMGRTRAERDVHVWELKTKREGKTDRGENKEETAWARGEEDG